MKIIYIIGDFCAIYGIIKLCKKEIQKIKKATTKDKSID